MSVLNSVGSTYCRLHAVHEPLCFVDIVERPEMSRGSVSQGLDFLRLFMAVKVLEIAGDQREFFEPELGLRRFARGMIMKKIHSLAKKNIVTVVRLKQQSEDTWCAKNGFQLVWLRSL